MKEDEHITIVTTGVNHPRYQVQLRDSDTVRTMTTWEYMRVYIPDDDDTILCLTSAGQDGWEFTGYTEDTGRGIRYLMKRPVIEG